MATITKVVKNGTTYTLSAEGLEQGIESAQTSAAQANTAMVQAQNVVTSTQKLIGGYLIPMFDSATTYHMYDLVFYQGNVYRCTQDRAPGPWGQPTENSFVQTSYYNEIRDMRGFTNYETIEFIGSVNQGTGSVVGKHIYVTYADTSIPSVTLTFNENGVATLTHIKGLVYSVVCEPMDGYAIPRTVTHTSNMNNRVINLVYRVLESGIYVINSAGVETDIELWDIANNFDAKLLKFADSDLVAANSSFAIAIHNRATYGSQKWCMETKQFVSIPNLGNATLAQADYDGWTNTQKVLEEAVGFVEAYNTAHPTAPTTIDAYVQAFASCNNTTMVIGGETRHAFLPSAGQIWKCKQNQSTINSALIYCGGTAINITSGTWWSSSQCSQTFAWFLGNGSLNYNYSKNLGFSVLPFFDF